MTSIMRAGTLPVLFTATLPVPVTGPENSQALSKYLMEELMMKEEIDEGLLRLNV